MPIALSPDQRDALFDTLETRFAKHPERHGGCDWKKIRARLESRPEKLIALDAMESTGGEPDVVAYDGTTDEYVFFDCSPESPKDRRGLCYDRAAWESRKEAKPRSSAMEIAAEMGIEPLTEEEYRYLQTLGSFDLKTSNWLRTPNEIRALGGAIFGDRRFGRVFVYHNGAESYYAGR